MSSVLERAVQGNRTAMHRVYEKERKLLYFLCLRLSANETEAAAIILRASHPARVNPILIAAVVCLFLAVGLWLASAFTGGESTQDGPVSSSVSDGASGADEESDAA